MILSKYRYLGVLIIEDEILHIFYEIEFDFFKINIFLMKYAIVKESFLGDINSNFTKYKFKVPFRGEM